MSGPPITDTVDDTGSDGAAVPGVPATERVGAARSLFSAAVYSLGFTVQRAIGLLLLPIYTRAITPAEYGTLGILIALYGAVAIVYSAALETSINRSYFQLAHDPAKRQEYLDSVWRFLLVYPLAASVVFSLLLWPVADAIGNAGGLNVALTLVAAALNVAATTLPLAVLRARHDLRGYLWMTAVAAIGTTAITLLFVVVLDQGVRGWMVAAVLANAAMLVTAFIVVPWHRRGTFTWSVTKAAVIFSLPLIPHLASHWALQLADRGVIAGMVSGADLGVYILAGNVATVVMMLVVALNQGFIPTYARAGVEDGIEDELAQVVVLQIVAVVALVLGAAMLGPPLIELLTPVVYHGAASLVPWLVLGFGFLGLYFVPMNGATLGVGRRTFAWVATAVSACLNIALLFIFVPDHGIEAAAISSAAGYLMLLILMSVWAHARHNPVTYQWAKIVPVVVAAGLTFAAATTTVPDAPGAAIAVATCWLMLFVLVVAVALFRTQLRRRLGF